MTQSTHTAPPETASTRDETADGVALVQGGVVNALTQLASLLRAIFTILVAWTLGSAALGMLAVAWSLAEVLSKIGNLGLETSAMTFVARRKELGDIPGAARVLWTSVGWGLGCSVLVALAGILVLQLAGAALGQAEEIVRAGSIMLLALPGIALYRISTGVSRGMWQMRHDLYSHGLTETLATTALFLVALGLGLGSLAPIVATVVGMWATGGVALWLARGLFRGVPPAHQSERLGRTLLVASWPVALNDLLVVLMLRMNILLLGLLVDRVPGLTLGVVGIYAAASELSNFIRKIQHSFAPMFTPIMASAFARDDAARMRRAFGQLGRWMLTAQLPVVAIFVVSGGLILCSYGLTYRSGALWLALLALANVLGTFSAVAIATTVVARPSSNLLTSLLVLPAQLILTLLLVRSFGATGAAIAAIGSHLIQNALRYWDMKRIFRWSWPWQEFVKPCAACILALLPAAVLRFFWSGLIAELVAGLAFLALYVLAWRWLGMDATDRAVFDKLLRRRGPVQADS